MGMGGNNECGAYLFVCSNEMGGGRPSTSRKTPAHTLTQDLGVPVQVAHRHRTHSIVSKTPDVLRCFAWPAPHV